MTETIIAKEPSARLLQMAKAWNLLRSMKRIESSNEGYTVLNTICEQCLEDREKACNQCKILHTQLDFLEKEMPCDLDGDDFKFDRTNEFVTCMRGRTLELEAQQRCQCGRNL